MMKAEDALMIMRLTADNLSLKRQLANLEMQLTRWTLVTVICCF